MAESSRPLTFVAVGSSVLALGLAVAALTRGGPTPETPTGAAADGERLTREERLTRLEDEVARLAERGVRARDTSRTRASPAPGGNATAGATADARLSALEAAVERLTDGLGETNERVATLQEGGTRDPAEAVRSATPTPEQVAELRRLALDEEADARPRLLAVRELARVPGGRTLEVARAMKKLFEGSRDERTRTAAVALLEGFSDPELEPWLVDTLLRDKYSSTRESATDVLSHYLGSQRVRDALADAAANDSNHDVRADAQNALDKIEEREQDR